MYVKDKMATNLITVGIENSISDVLDIMSSHGLHRIPVVDKQNHLLGLITRTTIQKHTPNEASSLSIFEMNYLLNKLTVEDVMIKDVKSIDKEALLEEAASQMRLYNVGCLPVVEDGTLIGIITHNDIFEAFIELLGYRQSGARYVINIKEDRAGILSDIAQCFKDNGINITNLAVYNTVRGIEVVVIATGDKSKECKKELEDLDYNVTSLTSLNN